MRDRFGSYYAITHDLGVVAEMAERVVVMYLGRIVEEGTVRRFSIIHPYTHALLRLSLGWEKPRPPRYTWGCAQLMFMPKGCKFHACCEFATETCRTEAPR